jgi:Calcium binding
MAGPRRSKAREARIDDEIVVDAYTPDERALSWYYYLEGKMLFPFRGRCTSSRSVSPLSPGQEVQVLSLAPQDDCRQSMLVVVPFAGRRIGVPLEQLKPVDADADTAEAVEDWIYWVAMGYEF